MASLDPWGHGTPARRRRLWLGLGALGLGAAGIVTGLVITGQRTSGAPKRPKDCLGPEGGTFRGVTYEEIVTGGADPNARLPLVVAFHGRGAAPRFMRPIVDDLGVQARVIIPQGIVPLGKNHAWWLTRSSGDQALLTKEMAKAQKTLAGFIKGIRACRPTRGKPIVVGHSQGGMMALLLAATHPGSVVRAVAGSAYLPEGFWRRGMAPAELVHGTDDDTVPYERTKDMVEEVRSLGNDWQLETIEDHGHGISGPLQSAWLRMVEDAVTQVGRK